MASLRKNRYLERSTQHRFNITKTKKRITLFKAPSNSKDKARFIKGVPSRSIRPNTKVVPFKLSKSNSSTTLHRKCIETDSSKFNPHFAKFPRPKERPSNSKPPNRRSKSLDVNKEHEGLEDGYRLTFGEKPEGILSESDKKPEERPQRFLGLMVENTFEKEQMEYHVGEEKGEEEGEEEEKTIEGIKY